ncbi:MAG: tRNA lysidine(34) synthetase TilS [Nostocoides sp.]
MPGPSPAVAAIRYAVRSALLDLAPGSLVLVACSGGADSLALAAAAVVEAGAVGLRAGAVVVDHGLQPGSHEVAARAVAGCHALGLDQVEVVTVAVVPTVEGLEAAARTARHTALASAADRLGASVVLLGHTLDDQAEQVLLGLARGSGARSLAGMPATRGPFVRPLLGITRLQTRQACRDEDLQWWDDPMNEDPAYARVRARSAVADLERDLGPGIAAALARTAGQLRADADHLDGLADAATADLGSGPWSVEPVAALAPAVRSRVWRRLLIGAGAPPGQVSSRHTEACDRLLTHWHGQGPLHAPGPLIVARRDGRITITPRPPVE